MKTIVMLCILCILSSVAYANIPDENKTPQVYRREYVDWLSEYTDMSVDGAYRACMPRHITELECSVFLAKNMGNWIKSFKPETSQTLRDVAITGSKKAVTLAYTICRGGWMTMEECQDYVHSYVNTHTHVYVDRSETNILELTGGLNER